MTTTTTSTTTDRDAEALYRALLAERYDRAAIMAERTRRPRG